MNQLVFDDDIYNTIRRNIKKYRKEKGLTAAELAELIGRSHDFIRQIESEKVAYNFSVETFYRISVALGCEYEQVDRKINKQKIALADCISARAIFIASILFQL